MPFITKILPKQGKNQDRVYGKRRKMTLLPLVEVVNGKLAFSA